MQMVILLVALMVVSRESQKVDQWELWRVVPSVALTVALSVLMMDDS